MATKVYAYHIYPIPGPRFGGWQCDAADGNDETIVEGYGKTPEAAMKDCKKKVAKEAKR